MPAIPITSASPIYSSTKNTLNLNHEQSLKLIKVFGNVKSTISIPALHYWFSGKAEIIP